MKIAKCVQKTSLFVSNSFGEQIVSPVLQANCNYYLAANKFNKAAGLILEWDKLPSIQQRSTAVSNLESRFVNC